MAEIVTLEVTLAAPSLTISVFLPDKSIGVEWKLFDPVYWGWKFADGSVCSPSDGGMFYVDGKISVDIFLRNVIMDPQSPAGIQLLTTMRDTYNAGSAVIISETVPGMLSDDIHGLFDFVITRISASITS